MIAGGHAQAHLFEETATSETNVPVRLNRIRLERGRVFGNVWLRWTLWCALGLDRLCAELLPEGRESVSHKETIEKHLVRRLGELFALDYDLLLYDVTSTCFEGLAEGNDLARRGHSRDHRHDCKQVCIALVVTRRESRSKNAECRALTP